MVATALDALPLATVRHQLRIETDADDATLSGMIGASIAWVERETSRHILDGTELRRYAYPGQNGPFSVRGRDIRQPTTVMYYADGDDLVAAPTRTVAPGRWLPGIRAGGAISELWPPSGGWPDVALRSLMEITFAVGVDADDIPPALIQAAIMLVREQYEGSGLDAIPRESGIFRLINPFRQYD